MRPEDQERILTEVESRVAGTHVSLAERRGASIEDVINDAVYHEKTRLKDERRAKTRQADGAFWDSLQRELRRTGEHEHQALLRRAIRRYAEEISGNFDDRVYQAVTRVMPTALGLLLNAVSPARLVRRL